MEEHSAEGEAASPAWKQRRKRVGLKKWSGRAEAAVVVVVVVAQDDKTADNELYSEVGEQ